MIKTKLRPYLLGLLLLCLGVSFILVFSKETSPTTYPQLDLTLKENRFFINEDTYEKEMIENILPFLETHKTNGTFSSQDGTALYYEQYLLPEPKAHVIMLHGFTENVQKYKEPIYYFLKQGYSVSLLDHRSHGYSERQSDDIYQVHIDSFEDYVQDLHTFITDVVTIDSDLQYFLYAHSMGGAIGSRYLELYPETFTAAVLSSPMMAIDTGNVPELLSKWIAKLMVLTGRGEQYIFGHSGRELTYNFEGSPSTSKARYDFQHQVLASDEKLQLSGGSFNWLNESFHIVDTIINEADKIATPILLFQSGNDSFVKPKGHFAFVNKTPFASLIQVEAAKHELFNTTNDIIIPYFNTIFNFYEEYLD